VSTLSEEETYWIECWDPQRSRPYYFHSRSKETSWVRPPEATCIAAKEWRRRRRSSAVSTSALAAARGARAVFNEVTTDAVRVGPGAPALPTQTSFFPESVEALAPSPRDIDSAPLGSTAVVSSADSTGATGSTAEGSTDVTGAADAERPGYRAESHAQAGVTPTHGSAGTQPSTSATFADNSTSKAAGVPWGAAPAAAATEIETSSIERALRQRGVEQSTEHCDVATRGQTESQQQEQTLAEEGHQSSDKCAAPCAQLHSSGAVHGWAAKRGANEAHYTLLYLTLRSGELAGAVSDAPDAPQICKLSLDPASSAVLSEDALGAQFQFVIAVTATDVCWFVGLDSIEDMQLWLEALQLHVRRTRMNDLPSWASEEGLFVQENGALVARRATVGDEDQASRHRLAWRGLHSPRRTARALNMATHQASGTGQTQAIDQEDLDALETSSWPDSFHSWAEKNGFNALESAFVDAGYDDLVLLAQLNEGDLKEMLAEHIQVEKPGMRMKIVLAVRALRDLPKPKN